MSTNTSAAAPGATLPARRGPAAAAGVDATQQQLAWQREMERAQMSAWFKPPVASSAREAAPPASRVPAASAPSARAAAPELRDADPMAALRDVAAEPAAAAVPIGSGTIAVVVPVPSTRTATASLAEGAGAVPVVEGRAKVDAQQAVRWAGPHALADAQAEPPPLPSTPEAPAPLRLHEETWPQGQAVWIAMRADDDTLLARLPQIVADLQRGLQDRGQHLHQVVCNGRLVWRDGGGAAAQEKFQPKRM